MSRYFAEFISKQIDFKEPKAKFQRMILIIFNVLTELNELILILRFNEFFEQKIFKKRQEN